MNIEDTLSVMTDLLTEMNLEATFLSSGSYAVAYRSKCGERVYKLTSDQDDALQAEVIMGTIPKFFAEVYQVFEVNNGNNPLFFIETQYYEPFWFEAPQIDEALGSQVFNEELIKYGFIYIDENPRNFGVDKEGNVRCFDFGYNSSSRLYENANFKKYDLHR